MANPFLDYIDGILMEEGDDDAACMQQFDHASYQAVFSGFYEILGEHVPVEAPPCSSADPRLPHHRMHRCHEKEAAEQQTKLLHPGDGSCDITHARHRLGASGISMPAQYGHSSQHEPAETGFTLEPDSRFQAHVTAGHTQISQLPEIIKHGSMPNSGSWFNINGLNNKARLSVSLSFDYEILAYNYHNVLADVMVSCWGNEGLSGHRCMQGHEQGNCNCQLLSADEDFASRLAEVALSFEGLKLNDDYVDLYVGERGSSCNPMGRASNSKHSRPKGTSLAGKGSRTRKTSSLEVHAWGDVKTALVSCAGAVAIGNVRRTNEILQELREVHGASANGMALQRTAHFFSKALAARMLGVGEHEFKKMSYKMPSTVTLMRATTAVYELLPFVKVIHYFANQSILKAAEGASRLHILDYGLMHGIQWPCLIRALADRKGGPPLLIITGIEFPETGVNPAKRLDESGQKLAAYAKTYKVPFQYHAIVSNKPELGLDAASLNLHKGDVLVVNCIKCLRYVADEGVDLALTTSPRQKVLNFMRSLNPHLLLIAVKHAEYNSPFFVSRFCNALQCVSNLFDLLEILWGDTPERLIFERSGLFRDILNIVGCEGTERVDRPETYKQWHARIMKAGFEQLHLPPTIVPRSRSHVKQHYHKDFLIHDDAEGWMLMGWKGQTNFAVSAWKPSLM